MVLIPAGTFETGEPARENVTNDAPSRQVSVAAFYMDTREVTNADYRPFLEAMQASGDHSRCHPSEPSGKDHTPLFWGDARYNRDADPVVGVDWYDAAAYAAWADKRLPTEAEWERAARGGVEGDQDDRGQPIDESVANVSLEGGEGQARMADIGQDVPHHQHGPKPVGSYAPNAFGLFDMSGNAEEWCLDWYDADYYPVAPDHNPSGPTAGTYKVVRGASWHGGRGRPGTRHAYYPLNREAYRGFRCVKPVSYEKSAP